MAKDFRTDRVRTTAIIGSGSITGADNALGLVLYSGSRASDFSGGIIGGTSAFYQNVGPDVWLLIDGTPNDVVDPRLKAHGSTVLFKGDVVVSGTLWAERQVIEVDDVVAGDLRAPTKVVGGHSTGYPENYNNGFARILVDPTTNNAGPNRNGTISFNVVQGSAGAYAYSTQFPDTHTDVFFHVSGSRGVKGTTDRGLALFDGDVMVSGNLDLHPDSILTIPGDLTVGGDLIVSGGDMILGTDDDGADRAIVFGHSTLKSIVGIDDDQDVFAINTDGTFESDNDLEIDSSGNLKIKGDIEVAGGTIRRSGGTGMIQLNATAVDVFSSLNVQNNLKLQGVVVNAADETAITLGGSVSPTIFAHDIRVSGQDIQGADGIAALHLSGSGNVTANKNLTVVGDLNVSGSVVSIGTENLRVKDAIVLLASGSSSSNTKGGIAIASGSALTDKALVFGTAATPPIASPGAFRAGYMDVQDGDVTSLDGAVPVDVQLAGIRFKNRTDPHYTETFITASSDLTKTTLEITNNDGDIRFTSTGNLGARFDGVPNGLLLGSSGEKLVAGSGRIQLSPLSGEASTGGGVRIVQVTGNVAKLHLGSSFSKHNYIYQDKQDDGLHISGSAKLSLGAVAESGESGLILKADSEEGTGGPILIVSASDQFNGATRQGFISLGATVSEAGNLFTSTRHRDVRTLLNGNVGTAGTNTRGVTLVAGDLVVSGNSELKGTTVIGDLALENLTLQSVAVGEPFIRLRDSSVEIKRNSLGHLEFTDIQAPGAPFTLTQLAALSVTDNTDVFAVTDQDGTAPYLSFVATTGSFSFDHDPNTNGYVPRRTNQIGDDVYFFVSGAIGSDGELPSRRATALFGGDVHVSGTIRGEVPYYVSTLGDAYSTPPGGSSTLSTGAGSYIDTSTSGAPVQIAGNSNDKVVIAVSGSMEFAETGAGANHFISLKNANRGLVFSNTAGDVFKIRRGDQGIGAGMMSTAPLTFNQDTLRIHGYQDGGVNILKITNASTNGRVHIDADSGNGHLAVTGSLLPGVDSSFDLGSPTARWQNVYTGDLHLKNERGNWTIYEEPDMLVVVNNITGKKYKMGLEPLEEK